MDRKHHNYGTYIGEVIACEVLGDCDKQHYPMPLHFEYEYAYKHEDELHKRYDGDKQAIDILDGRNKCGCEVVQASDRTPPRDVKQCEKCPLLAYCKQITDRYCCNGSNWRYACKRSKSKGVVQLVLYLKSQTGRVEMSHSHEWRVSKKGVEELSCDRLALIKRAVECKVKKAGKYQRIIGKPVDLFVELNIDAVPHETAEEAVHELAECYRGIDGIEGFRYIYIRQYKSMNPPVCRCIGIAQRMRNVSYLRLCNVTNTMSILSERRGVLQCGEFVDKIVRLVGRTICFIR